MFVVSWTFGIFCDFKKILNLFPMNFSPDEEGICESRHFTQNGLVHLVEKTAQFMEKAQMYESMVQLYKVIKHYYVRRNQFFSFFELRF